LAIIHLSYPITKELTHTHVVLALGFF